MADVRTARRPAPSIARLLVARWRARAGIQASGIAAVAVAVATVCGVVRRLEDAVPAADASAPGVPHAEVTAQLAAGAAALAGAAPSLVLAVLLLACAATAQLARLTTAARASETATLRARGLSHRQSLLVDVAEATLACAAGALLGWAAASLIAGVAGDAMGPADGRVALATAALLCAVRVIAGRRAATAGRAGARVATTAAVVLLLLAGAALALWQLRRASPGSFDPAVALAPTAVLLAGSFAVLALLATIARATAAAAARSPGLEPATAARQVARRMRVHAVVVLLVALAVGQAVFAAGFDATWSSTVARSAALRSGADLRVDVRPASVTPELLDRAASVDGVAAAAPALIVPIEFGDTEAELVAVPSASLGTVLTGDADDLAELRDASAPRQGSAEARPVPLGEGATTLRVVLRVTGVGQPAERLRLTAVVGDASGAATTLRFPSLETVASDGGTVTAAAETALPAGADTGALLALIAELPQDAAALAPQVTVGEATAGGRSLGVAGDIRLRPDRAEQVLWLAEAAGTDGAPPVRAAVSAALAARLGATPGDALELDYAGSGRRTELVVGDIVDAVPGASGPLAVFVPLETLTVAMLQRAPSIVPPSSVLAAGDVGAGAALSAALDDRPVVTAAPDAAARVVGTLVPGWWIAAAGSGALAMLAATAVAQTLALVRRGEIDVLRALGVTPDQQARTRAGELAAVLASAALLGAGTGAIAAALTVPALVRAVTPGLLALGTGDPLRFAATPLLWWSAALVLALAAIVAAGALAVRRAASAPPVSDEP